MTKKDYIAIAALFAAINPTPAIEALAREMARVFAADNPRFDRARFLAACMQYQADRLEPRA